MAELAVFSRAPPVAEEAKAEKAPRSKFCAAPRCKKFRAPQESRGSAAAKTIKYAGMAELADALDSGFYTRYDEFPICRNIPKRLAFSAEKRCAVGT